MDTAHTKNDKISPDYLIPPDSDLAQMLLQWSEDNDSRVWQIANTTNELIIELEGGMVTKQDVYRAVAARCKGQKPNTIRRWAEVAADYPPELQGKYSQLLSFQHFKTSRRLYQEGLTPSLEYGLQWCVEGNDDKLQAGKFHTVGELLANFLPSEKDKTPLKRRWDAVRDSLYDLFLLVDNDFYRQQLLDNWKELDYIIKEVDRLSREEVLDRV